MSSKDNTTMFAGTKPKQNSISRAGGDCWLDVGFAGDDSTAEFEADARDGAAMGRVASPVRVTQHSRRWNREVWWKHHEQGGPKGG